MELREFISDTERNKQLARACNTSRQYLWQIANRWNGRKAGPKLAQRIEIESERIGPERVPKESLRPDLWGQSA